MIQRLILRLKSFGIQQIIVNVHHYAGLVTSFLEQHHNFGLDICISDETGLLLDTGGAVKKASWFLDGDEPFLLHNVDVISNLEFPEMLRYHLSTGAMATLGVSERISSRYFLFDNEYRLCGWENPGKGERLLTRSLPQELIRLAFSGIHIIDPSVFRFIIEEGRFSLVDLYLRLAPEHRIMGFQHSADDWMDLGKLNDLEKAEELMKNGRFR
jgi:NDP-sugar pyrophosphorylase family protein